MRQPVDVYDRKVEHDARATVAETEKAMRELSRREENEHASESCRARTRENVGSETEYEYLRDSEYLPEVGIG